jgi:hypothetical protein
MYRVVGEVRAVDETAPTTNVAGSVFMLSRELV